MNEKNPRLFKKEVTYRITSGSPTDLRLFWPANNLREARKTHKEVRKSNPHQGGGHHIVKITTIYESITP